MPSINSEDNTPNWGAMAHNIGFASSSQPEELTASEVRRAMRHISTDIRPMSPTPPTPSQPANMEDWYTCFIQGQANQTAEKPWQGWIVKFSNNGTVARFERASYGSSSQQRAKDKLLKSTKDNMKSLCNEINDYMESVARSKRSLDAINNLTPEAEPASEPASPAPARY